MNASERSMRSDQMMQGQ